MPIEPAEIDEARRLQREIRDAISMLNQATDELPMYVFDRPMNREIVVSNLQAAAGICRRLAKEVLPEGL